jgi:quercetin dioxygenase-like cupin family protein
MPDTPSYPVADAGGGVTRQVLSQSPEIMLVAVDFPKDGVGALHSHAHVQATLVEAGRFEFTIDSKSFTVGPGDSFVVPSNAVHGCRALEAGRLIDCFTPRRDDFL